MNSSLKNNDNVLRGGAKESLQLCKKHTILQTIIIGLYLFISDKFKIFQFVSFNFSPHSHLSLLVYSSKSYQELLNIVDPTIVSLPSPPAQFPLYNFGAPLASRLHP